MTTTRCTVSNHKTVLHILELGGYPDPGVVCNRHGLRLEQVHSMRKGLAALGRMQPDIIVAEFNYLPTYGSQISNVESLLARLQGHAPETRVILLYHAERREHLQRLHSRFPLFATLAYPVRLEQLEQALQRALEGGDEGG